MTGKEGDHMVYEKYYFVKVLQLREKSHIIIEYSTRKIDCFIILVPGLAYTLIILGIYMQI